MAFNVSRFLVRVRRFWTRKRLVPFLGITAIFLFLLNFVSYLDSFFEKRPIIALHALGENGGLHLNSVDEPDLFIYRFRNDLELDLQKRQMELELNRHHLDRLRNDLERHRDQLHRRIRIHRSEEGHNITVQEEGNVKEFVIDGATDQNEDVRIEVNGRHVSVNGKEVEIL